MKFFEYIIKDEIGIHARPAGMLVKLAKNFVSKINLIKDEKTVDTTKLMAIMSMGIKKGDKVQIVVEGVDEDEAFDTIKNFFEENL